MKRREEEKATQGPLEIKKPRFKIEKLEERIAPKKFCGRDGCYHYSNCHYNPNAGKYVGCGKP